MQGWLARGDCDATKFTDCHARRVLGTVDGIPKASRPAKSESE